MAKPRLLDLFCKAGGAGMGYARAGFDVVGVDIEPQPNYPFEFIQADALAFLRGTADSGGFAAIHASPPCQAFTAYRRCGNVKKSPNLIPETRKLLQAIGLPWIIENVVGSPLVDPVLLCGSMFDPPLDVRRHRLFEVNWNLYAPRKCNHKCWPANRYPGGRSKERTGKVKGLVRNTCEIGVWKIPLGIQQSAIGIDWMNLKELSQAIPPAYTETIGRQLLSALYG